MAVITTGAHPKALWPGIKAWWGRTYREHPTEYTRLFMRESSSQSYEEDVEATGFGLVPVKNEGAAIQYDSEAQGTVTRYTHVVYSGGYIVTEEELEDNLYPVVSRRRGQALQFALRQTIENVGANVFNRAFDPNYTHGDGVEMCATNHPTVDGTQSNELSAAADLSEASIEDLVIQIGKAKNSRGLKISLMPRTLVIPVDLQFEANRILKSVQQNDTANNAINSLRSMGIIPNIEVNHYFSDTDAWFILTNAPNGLKYYNRREAELQMDNDFDTSNARAKVSKRCSFGISDFRAVFGSPGA